MTSTHTFGRRPHANRSPCRAVPFLARVGTLAAVFVAVAGCGTDPQPITVMTRNLYLGADLTPLFTALTRDELASSSGQIWRQVLQSTFEARAQQVAREITLHHPDVIALQEVSLFRTQTPGDWQPAAAPNASHVDLDFLEILLSALSAEGSHYRFGDTGAYTDQELPATAADGTSFDVRLTDRNVILVREGLTFSPGPAAAFNAVSSFPAGGFGGATITLQRGTVSTDVSVADKRVRVVNTHLEVGGPLARIQEQQARELLSFLASTTGPIILAGDFNSQADGTGTMTYGMLTTAAGGSKPFRDTWPYRNRERLAQNMTTNLEGNTCCLDLNDAIPLPTQRIDLVLFRGGVQPRDIMVVTPSKTPGGLWPSDHLGVYAELQIQ